MAHDRVDVCLPEKPQNCTNTATSKTAPVSPGTDLVWLDERLYGDFRRHRFSSER